MGLFSLIVDRNFPFNPARALVGRVACGVRHPGAPFRPGRILWRENVESVTGPFINGNTAGAYFGSCTD